MAQRSFDTSMISNYHGIYVQVLQIVGDQKKDIKAENHQSNNHRMNYEKNDAK